MEEKTTFDWTIKNWTEVQSTEDPSKLDRVVVSLKITDPRFPGEAFLKDINIPSGFINSLSDDPIARRNGIINFLEQQARAIHFDWAQIRSNQPPPPPPPVTVPLHEVAAAFGTVEFKGVQPMTPEERTADETKAMQAVAGFEPKSKLL
jgi:hypothetical protein